jgi:hypothetical protein
MTITMRMIILTGVSFPLVETINDMTEVTDKGPVKIWTSIFLFQGGMRNEPVIDKCCMCLVPSDFRDQSFV